VRRAFAGVPELEYMRDLRAGRVPANVSVSEFYFRPGAMLGLPAAQQSYISSNYTHVARDMRARGVNAVLVMVAERAGRYSLSSNPDLTLDVVRAMRAQGAPCIVAGLVNRNLPFMLHDADVGADYFDVLVDAPHLQHPLFGVPNPPAEPADHAIGIHAAALVKDGGTLQLGIGSLGDAVAYWLGRRHTDSAAFASALTALNVNHDLLERARLRRGPVRFERDVQLGPDAALPRPERLTPLARRGLLPLFPLGTDFDAEEQRFVAALLWLKRHFSILGIAGAPRPRAEDLPALARMGLASPRSMRERVLRRIVTFGLRRASD
jgi:acyl-CoA hydrolase